MERTKKEYEKELKDRFQWFFMTTEGDYHFPNS